jgi:hypothetical protein
LKNLFFLFGVSYNVGLDAWLHILLCSFFAMYFFPHVVAVCSKGCEFVVLCFMLDVVVYLTLWLMVVLPFILDHYFLIELQIRVSKSKSSLACSVKFHQLHYCLCFGSRGGQNRGPFGSNQATGYVHLRSLNFIVLFQGSFQFIFVTRAVHSMSYFGSVVNQTLVNVVVFLESFTNQICSGASLLKWFLHLNMSSVL